MYKGVPLFFTIQKKIMAKKRSKKKGHHPVKKKKVSGSAEIQEFAMRAIGVAGGALAGAFLIQAGNTALSSQSMPLWVVPGAVAVTGALIPLVIKKNPLAEDVGMGMLAVGAIFAANESFLSVPGISGLAMSSNAGPANKVLRMAVGCKQMGSGPQSYLKQTVGGMRNMSSAMKVGMLSSN